MIPNLLSRWGGVGFFGDGIVSEGIPTQLCSIMCI
jgi:hypothetical protein